VKVTATTSFGGASAGDDQQRTIGMGHRLPLLRVERRDQFIHEY
jgi:hypothetical protein